MGFTKAFRWFGAAIFLSIFSAPSALPVELGEMSLEDLSKLEIIPAMMTSSSGEMVPASVTTITEEDIRMTPARNLYDLLEVYVPGALWIYHNEGNHLSLRGLSSDRETKILLLVNGVKINQDGYAGAVDEIINWDLRDIRMVQVIRGPGSVTYGPGAIEAVINIITKDSSTSTGFKVGAQANSTYNSAGSFLSFGKKSSKVGVYMYGSFVSTQGYQADTWDVDTNGTYGRIGDGTFQNGRRNCYWFSDYRDTHPQLKFFAQLQFLNDWKMWLRFNQVGWTQEPAVARSFLPGKPGPWPFERQILTRYAIVDLENKHRFSEKVRVKTELGFHSYDRVKDEATPVVGDRESARNRNPVFGANRFYSNVTCNFSPSPKFELAIGGGYVNEYVGKGWNRDAKDMYIYGIVSGPGSTRSGTYAVGNGWFTQTLSAFSEANLKLHPMFNVIVSGRTDKNKYTDALFSPRVALLSDMGGKGVFKLIGQKAQRMNDLGELFIASRKQFKPPPEELRGAEFIWNSPKGRKLDVSIATFYNRTKLLGFNQTTLNVTRLGTIDIGGVEVEIRKQVGRFTGGVNHSYADLGDFHLGKDVKIASISYADAIQVSGGGTLNVTGTGHDINNWANNATKLFARYRVVPDRMTLHTDARVFWGFEGKQAALEMFQNAIGTLSPTNRAIAQRDLDFLYSKEVGKLQWRLDASVEYVFTGNTTLVVWGQNLLGKRAVRYGYDGGANRIFPTRFEFTEEPVMVGGRIERLL